MRNIYVGIHITNEKIEIYILPSEECWDTGNNHSGMEEMVERLKGLHPRLIVLKAAGGTETLVAAMLYAAGLPVEVVNNREVRDFAHQLGISDKSDAINAQVIARLAEEMVPQHCPLHQEQELMFKELIMRRQQLVKIQMAETNQLQQHSSWQISQSINNLIEAIEHEIDKIDRKIEEHIKFIRMR